MQRRFKRNTKSFSERQQDAERRSKVSALRRCPDCGALCKWYAGNFGNRAACEKCGG